MTKNKLTIGAIVRISLPNSPYNGQSGIVSKIVCNGRGAMVKIKGGPEAYYQTGNLELTGQWGGPWEKWGGE